MNDIDFRELWKLTDNQGKPLRGTDKDLISYRIEIAELIKRDIDRQIEFLKALEVDDVKPSV